MTRAVYMKGAKPHDAGGELTVARIDNALKILARIMRDHGELFEAGELMAMAQKLYDERTRLNRPNELENLMANLMKVA
ncbi:hypothetical protein [Thalassospira marina]|uniref:Uncharacterized protein n=1 Tax=Thalassospira marina TaxID=2048283 RepID=A0A2N3KV53_9PROT|nr:hypothetical protein [Thalassospira marina]PKR54442.1 hypothetical protein COO20_09945 [Thalassospira marina]